MSARGILRLFTSKGGQGSAHKDSMEWLEWAEFQRARVGSGSRPVHDLGPKRSAEGRLDINIATALRLRVSETDTNAHCRLSESSFKLRTKAPDACRKRRL